jgi:cell wall-associated NlpC family hydrolase
MAVAAPAPAREQSVPVVPSSTVWHGAQDLAIYALGLIGVDYKFGGNTPERGLDCSGLVRYVFQQVTGVTLSERRSR